MFGSVWNIIRDVHAGRYLPPVGTAGIPLAPPGDHFGVEGMTNESLAGLMFWSLPTRDRLGPVWRYHSLRA